MKSIIVFTILIHAVVLLGSSVPFLMKTVKGEDTSKLSEQDRIDKAVREAAASLREIAEEHGLNPQDLSSQFAEGKTKPPASVPVPAPAPGVAPAGEGEPGEPKSTVEKELDVKADGPKLPAVEDEEEDLFK